MSRTLLAALALVAAPALPASAADLEFKEYAPKEGGFKVQFPGEPKASETKQAKGPTVYSVTSQPKPGHVYTITYLDLPAEIPANMVKETLPKFAAGIKGKAVSEKEVTLGKEKLPGRDAVYEMTGAHIRHYMILDGKRLYQVIVGGPAKEDVESADADKFIKSFQVVK